MTPINITVQHPSTVSAADVLNIINSEVDTVAPVVVQALPQTADSSKISAYVTAGELALAVINSIVQQIHARHQTAIAAQNLAATGTGGALSAPAVAPAPLAV